MRTMDRIDNTADVIDSRDVIARIEEIETELRESLDDAELDVSCLVPDDLFGEDDRELLEEWTSLTALARQGADYAPDWEYGEALVRDSYFKDYARELAEDCGMVSSDAEWPARCIDWEQAARGLRMDYTSIDFDGVTYWTR